MKERNNERVNSKIFHACRESIDCGSVDDTEENGSLVRASDRACDDANDVRRLQLRQHRHLQGAEKIMGVRIKMGK